MLNDKIDSEISDPIRSRLGDIKCVDDLINLNIDHDDKVNIVQIIITIMGELIINYLTEFICFYLHIFQPFNRKNIILYLTPLLRFNLVEKII